MVLDYPQTTNDPGEFGDSERISTPGHIYPQWVGFGKQNRRGGFIQERGKGAEGGLIKNPEGRWSISTAGLWSWKSKSAKKCVTTYPPNRSAPKMDGAQALLPFPCNGVGFSYITPLVGGIPRVGGIAPSERSGVYPPSVQISVVVASTQGSSPSLRVEEGKGSTGT